MNCDSHLGVACARSPLLQAARDTHSPYQHHSFTLDPTGRSPRPRDISPGTGSASHATQQASPHTEPSTHPPGQTFHSHFLLTLVWGALHAVTPHPQHPQRRRLIKNTTHTPQNECKALGRPLLLKPHQARCLSAFQPLLGAKNPRREAAIAPHHRPPCLHPLPRPPKTKASFSLLLEVTTFSSNLRLFSFCPGPSWLASPSTAIPRRQTLYCFHRPNK